MSNKCETCSHMVLVDRAYSRELDKFLDCTAHCGNRDSWAYGMDIRDITHHCEEYEQEDR